MVLESNTLDVLFVKDGQQGEDGKILYTWIKYAKDASGTGITNDPNGAIYIGISYNNESSIESNDPTQYAWTKIQGADGKKGEDAYTIFLENENISFATDKNRNPLSEQAYTSGITIMKGAKPVTDFTIGDIAKTQGIAVAKTDTAIAISVVNGNPLPNDSGEIEIPITVGGTVFKKILTWTCAKKGDKGDTGQKGQDGEKFAWNLINNGKGDVKKGFFKNFSSVNATEKYGEITLTSKHHYIGIDLPGFVLNPRQYEVGKKVTWSYDIMYTKWDFPTGSNRQEYWIGQRYTGAPSGETATGQWVGVTSHNLPVVGQNGCELNKWFHVEVTKTIPTPASSNVGYQECINFYNSTDISATVTLRMKNVKLEYGDTATPWSPAQSDLEGRGVSQTVQYYLATSQASGVTSSTSGWSTDITTQKLTADKKYLWNCYQTKYSDGTSEPISTPKVIGVYGDKGTSTKIIRTSYEYTQTNIDKFSTSGYSGVWGVSDATTDLKVGDSVLLKVKNTTKGSDCLIFANITAIPSNYSLTCTSYGGIDNGSDGQDGENAKNLSITPSSQYFKSTDGGKTFAPNAITIKPTIQGEISFGKWQYSIDGGVSFTDVVSGQKGLTISNNMLTFSKDSSLYSDVVTMVTFRAVANDSSFYDTCSIAKIYDVGDIGDGRNLLWNSNFAKTDEAITGTTNSWGLLTRGTNLVASIDTSTKHNGFNTLKTVSAANGDKNSSSDLAWFAWGISERTSDNLHSKNQNYTLSFYAKASVTTDFIVRWGYDAYGADTTRTLTTNWQKYEIKLHQATSAYSITIIFKLLTAGTVWFSEFKLEKGSSATGYSTAPEDFQTAILSTKSEISDVSSQVDKNKQAIEQRVEKTTYQQDLKLVKGDISKANEGLNKWRYEIYPKSLFTDKPEDQRKISLDVFARNKNIIPTQSILLDDTKLGQFNYDDNYIGYAVTFVKMSEATKLETTFVHDDAGSFYLNGKLICTNGKNNFYSSATPDTVSCTLAKGWNCLEVVINEGTGSEGFKFGTVLSQLSTCQLMNCYYAMVTGRESQITNTLVQNTIDIEGVSTKVGKVTSVIGENGENFTSFENDYSDFKQTMNGFKTTVGQTYVTKDDFNGLEIGGRNLLRNSGKFLLSEATTGADYSTGTWHFAGSSTMTKSHVEISDPPKSCQGVTGAFQAVGSHPTTSPDGECIGMDGFPYFDEEIGSDVVFSGWARVVGGGDNCYFGFSSYMITFSDGKLLNNYNCIKLNTDGSWTRIVIHGKTTKKVGNIYCGFLTGTESVTVQACGLKLEKGNKATDWTPAPEDNEINGQNLVSNLPSNWEQGGINGGQAVGSTYASIKSSTTYRIRIKDIFSVSGNIAVSAGGTTTNSAKETLSFYGTLYDAKRGLLRETGWKSFPSIINCGDAKYMSIILRWGDGTKTQITPSDISQICLKIERGTSATPFTLAHEDVNGKIVNVETIANQTAKKFEWIVKGGNSSSNFTLTDRVADLVAERINFNGLVKFSGLAKSTQDKINSPTSGNLITVSPTNPTSNYGNTTFSIVPDDAGGRCIQTIAPFVPFTNYASNIFKPGEQIYYNICVPNWSSTTFDANLGIWFFTAEKKCVANSCTRVTLQRTTWNRLSGYITVPTSGWSGIIYYVIGIENPNKYQLGLVSNSYIEKTTSYATTYASSAVNWVTNNGSSTTSLNSMVKKWTDGAVSDTTQINGGWIKANTITASKIAVGDFTNYADINESNTYGFSVEKTTDGVWFSKDGSKLTRDNYISKMYSCEPGQTFYVEYDISNTIKDSTEYKAAGIMLFGCDGTQTVKWYQRRGAVVGTAAGTVTHMSQQLTMPSGTRFFYVVLQIEGHPPFTGTLKIRNLSVRKAVTGAVIVDGSITADKIATDAIKSRNYISSGGTQGSFLNLSDGSFQSPNLSWDSNGNLIAKNANLSGQITATKGSIGGWSVDNYSIYTTYDADQNIFGSGISGTKGKYVLWAGETNNAMGANRSSDTPTDASLVIYTNGGLEVRKTMVGNDKKNHLYTTILQSGQINLKMDDNYIGTITATDTISSNSTVTMSHVSMAAKKGYGWSILHTDDSGNLISDIQRDPSDTKIKINSPITVFSTDISKYNAIETTGDVVVSGKIHANYGSNKIQLNPDNNGSIELYGYTPFIDFHYGNSDSDYTSRIIAQEWGLQIVGTATVTGDLYCDAHIYTCTNGHFSWAGQTDAYLGCGNYSGGNNIYYYANYHAFYVNNDSGSGMMYINTNGVTSRVGFTKTSDERIKKNFESFDDNIIDAYMNIEPVKYQLKQSSNDNYHFGFKAQHVDKVFSDYGDTYNESFDICTSRPIDPDKAKELYGVDDMTEEYGLRYDELIAPTTYMVQHIYKELESTKGELAKVKQEKADLETRLQAIEAKLGL